MSERLSASTRCGRRGVWALLVLSVASCSSYDPIGTWRQDVAVSGRGTERHCLYTLKEDKTFDYVDHREYNDGSVAEDHCNGVWSSIGDHVTMTWLSYYGTSYTLADDNSTSWTISGDTMTSGMVELNRVK